MRASHLSLHLIRYDTLRTPPSMAPATAPSDASDDPSLLFCGLAADVRAAGTDPGSQQAFVFALLGLHCTADSAHRLVTDGHTRFPWFSEAVETWAAVLEPFRNRDGAAGIQQNI